MTTDAQKEETRVFVCACEYSKKYKIYLRRRSAEVHGEWMRLKVQVIHIFHTRKEHLR